MATVEVRHITLTELPHQRGTPCRIARREQQVNVIGHQAIRVNRTASVPGELTQARQIDKPIGIFAEAILAIHAAMTHMHRDAGNYEALGTAHDRHNGLGTGAVDVLAP